MSRSVSSPGVRTERGETPRVAVVIPCCNEAVTIGKVVADFRRELPNALLLVVDNASSDDTGQLARTAGATVVHESRRGKGYALIRGFQEARGADFVVMVDGDDTYDAGSAHAMLAAAMGGADMVIGTRLEQFGDGAFSIAHNTGNRLFRGTVRVLFGVRTKDLFSGYRVLSQRLLDASPLIAHGFEVETELSLHALMGGFVVTEISTPYRARPHLSTSKLRTYHDGYRIAVALLAFFRDYRPLTFFGVLSGTLLLLALWAGSYPVFEYFRTGFVLRLPLAVLAVGLSLLSAVSVIGGLILSSIRRRSMELASLVLRIDRDVIRNPDMASRDVD